MVDPEINKKALTFGFVKGTEEKGEGKEGRGKGGRYK